MLYYIGLVVVILLAIVFLQELMGLAMLAVLILSVLAAACAVFLLAVFAFENAPDFLGSGSGKLMLASAAIVILAFLTRRAIIDYGSLRGAAGRVLAGMAITNSLDDEIRKSEKLNAYREMVEANRKAHRERSVQRAHERDTKRLMDLGKYVAQHVGKFARPRMVEVHVDPALNEMPVIVDGRLIATVTPDGPMFSVFNAAGRLEPRVENDSRTAVVSAVKNLIRESTKRPAS